MNPPPFQEGDFIWCAFPERENPAQPGPLHIGYAVMVSGVAASTSAAPASLMVYTTSQQWPPDTPLPLGVLAFSQAEASRYGQSKAFTMDLRRVAYLPVTQVWFPYLNKPGYGVQGRASKADQRRFRQIAEDLATRHAELLERLGPLWPRPRR